jgi:putative transposase
MVSFKGAHFTKDINLTCVRWYVAYSLSYRQVEERMQERGVSVDHATSNRWVLKYSPQPKPHSTAASARSGSAGG